MNREELDNQEMLSFSEIGERLGISRPTVKKIYESGIQKILDMQIGEEDMAKRGPKPTETVYVFQGLCADKECETTVKEIVKVTGKNHADSRARILCLDPVRTYERIPVREPRLSATSHQ